MMYKVISKQEQITTNKKIMPDGFGTWGVFNIGTAPILLNGVIPIPAGSRYELPLEPYCKWWGDLVITFNNDGTKINNAIIFKLYYEKIEE